MEFKDLEKSIFSFACDLACEITKQILEERDEEIKETRDTKRYRMKRLARTSIKTVYGDVEYRRRSYIDRDFNKEVYLLDDEMNIEKEGLYSTNMVELITEACTKVSFGEAADQICSLSGLNIGKTSCWNIFQKVGRKITEKEKELSVNRNNVNQDGRIVKNLFEETDGVWLSHQLKNKKKGRKMEVKLYTIYEGWKAETNELVNKTYVGGNCTGKQIKKKADAMINSIYNIDEIEHRILNGDGAAWIDDNADDMIIYQLDRFHVCKYITRYIAEKKIRDLIFKALRKKDIDRMLEVIEAYKNSYEGTDDKKAEDAEILYRYLSNHKNNILSYKERGIELKEPDGDVVYKNMGVQENQNCTLITMRMKNRRMRWSEVGADNMVKVLCWYKNKMLNQLIEESGITIEIDKSNIEERILSAAEVMRGIGKGDKYADLLNVSVPIISSGASPLTKALRNLITG